MSADGPDAEQLLTLVNEYAERIDNEVVREISGQTGDGEPISGLQINHGDHVYLALATSNWEFVQLRFSFNGDEAWHVRRSTADLTEGGQIEVSQEDIRNARREFETELESQPPERKRELRLNLMQILSREGCSVTFDTTQNSYNIHGFNVDKKIFPDDDSFSVGDYEKAVQTIIDLGWVGKEFLIENYGLRRGLD